MVLHFVHIASDERGGKVIDHHPVRWIAQFPRDLFVPGPFRKIAKDDLSYIGDLPPEI